MRQAGLLVKAGDEAPWQAVILPSGYTSGAARLVGRRHPGLSGWPGVSTHEGYCIYRGPRRGWGPDHRAHVSTPVR